MTQCHPVPRPTSKRSSHHSLGSGILRRSWTNTCGTCHMLNVKWSSSAPAWKTIDLTIYMSTRVHPVGRCQGTCYPKKMQWCIAQASLLSCVCPNEQFIAHTHPRKGKEEQIIYNYITSKIVWAHSSIHSAYVSTAHSRYIFSTNAFIQLTSTWFIYAYICTNFVGINPRPPLIELRIGFTPSSR